MANNADATPKKFFQRMREKRYYENFMALLVSIPILKSNKFKHFWSVTIFAILFYQLLMSHHDIFVDEVARYVYCRGPNDEFAPLARTIQKYLRFTSGKYFEFEIKKGSLDFKPDIDKLAAYCSEENMHWNVIRLVRSSFGIIFMGICWVGMRMRYESMFPPFIIYGTVTFFLDWHHWLDDVTKIFKSSTVAIHVAVAFLNLSMGGLGYTMWSLYSEFCYLYRAHRGLPQTQVLNEGQALLENNEAEEPQALEMVPLMPAEPGQAEQGEAGLEMVPLMRPESRQAEQEGAKSVVAEMHV